ncbi:MmcB family DNA repair protein [Sphingomonas sp.]|uniref:MmcB family DNA repair protein n=1 Tax=Sphingomonas sp. TaxID=28214 RepID=UPI0025DC6984|nr:MmcB family DNA repair protein [Sphingomonas sp.]
MQINVVDVEDIAAAVTTAEVVRGTARLLLHHDCLTVTEVSLGNGRRADLMGLCPKGLVTIVEVKTSRADLLGDAKWIDYLDYCDRFFWAVPLSLSSLLDRPEMLPDRAGLIIADRYDAAIVREATSVPLASSRRRAETLRFARRAARRLLGDLDNGVTVAT